MFPSLVENPIKGMQACLPLPTQLLEAQEPSDYWRHTWAHPAAEGSQLAVERSPPAVEGSPLVEGSRRQGRRPVGLVVSALRSSCGGTLGTGTGAAGHPQWTRLWTPPLARFSICFFDLQHHASQYILIN